MFTRIALAFAIIVGTAAAFNAQAQSPRGGRSHAIHTNQVNTNSNAVYFDGKKVGQDPDAHVRAELLEYAHSGAL
jgi:hypothetical protein